MGVVLFDKSGTFKPSEYGLKPGDTIEITCVGGGGGGQMVNGAGGDAGKGGNTLGTAAAGDSSGGGGGGGAGYGGGGGGGGTSRTAGGGGGGGGYLQQATLEITNSNVNTDFPITVGAGGTGQADRYSESTAGETSSFGSVCTAEGGNPGADNLGGTGGTKGGDGGVTVSMTKGGAGGGGGGGGWIPGTPITMRGDGGDGDGHKGDMTGGGGGGIGSTDHLEFAEAFDTNDVHKSLFGGTSKFGGHGGNGCSKDPMSASFTLPSPGSSAGPGSGCVMIQW